MTEKQPHTIEQPPKDVSKLFLDVSVSEWQDTLRTLRKEQALTIHIDLSGVDKESFVTTARRLKGFIEGGDSNQRRYATVCLRQEQLSWEANVFSSGVTVQYID